MNVKKGQIELKLDVSKVYFFKLLCDSAAGVFVQIKSYFQAMGVLAFILNSVSAFACPSFPKKITLKDATFTSSSEPMQIGSTVIPDLKGEKSSGKILAITHGDTLAFFHPEKRQWCLLQKDDKTSVSEQKYECVKDNTKINITDDHNGGKKSGVIEIKGNTIYFFSINDRGQKDITRPYLSLTDESADRNLKITAEAKSGTKPVGHFEMTDTSLIMRGLSIGSADKVFDLNGHRVEATGSCSDRAKETDFSANGSSGGGNSSPDSQGGAGAH